MTDKFCSAAVPRELEMLPAVGRGQLAVAPRAETERLNELEDGRAGLGPPCRTAKGLLLVYM